MINRLLPFLILLVTGPASAQYLKTDLVADLLFLNDAVEHGHPVNYDPAQPGVDIRSVIEEVKSKAPDTLSALQYTLWIGKGVFHIGCVHTSIQKNPLKSQRTNPSFIPLTASVEDDKLTISSSADSSMTGTRIESINGHSALEITHAFQEFKASDGVSSAFANEYFQFASSSLISSFLQHPVNYTIRTDKNELTVSGIAEAYHTPERKVGPAKDIATNCENRYYQIDDFAVLEVRTFNKSDKKFFRSFFQHIDESKIGNLMIDLRQNTGGNRKAAIVLTRHLVDTTFGYSILQPKIKTWSYLNQRGKRLFLLSKIRYNMFNVVNRRRNPLGKEFRYTYKPASRFNFDGRVFVVTDGFTASASTMVTSWLKQFSETTFVGTQAGGGYNGNNGGSFPSITLPKSGIEIKFPAYRLILDRQSATRTGLMPDLPIESDEEIAAIVQKIRQHQ